MTSQRKQGQRVFTEKVNAETGESRRRYGTVDRDETPLWDYVDIRFDDMPTLVQAVLGYYLFDADAETD